MIKAIDGGRSRRYNHVNKAGTAYLKGDKTMKKFFEILFALAVSLVVDDNADCRFSCFDGCEMPVEAYC